VHHEAEDPGAQHVPEGYGHEAHQRPFHGFHPRRALLEAPAFKGFVAQHDERHDLKRTERGTNSHYGRGGASEVQVVQRAGYTAQHEQRRRSEAGDGGATLRHQAHGREDEGQCRGGEDLEEAFHPQVHDPPAPVFHDGDVRTLAIEQAGTVEQADRHNGTGEQGQQVLVAFLPERRQNAAQHQQQPEGQAQELDDLPYAAELDVLVTLVAKPEIEVFRHDLLDGEVVADIRAHHQYDQRPEQDIDAQLLILGVFAAVDDRHQEQP